MELNVLVRGQSNAILMMEAGNWAGSGAITQEVQRLLGFDGTTDRVNLIYDRFDANSSTAFGGTALIGDWLTARNGDWRQGWDVGQYERALLNEIAGLPATQRDDPTAILWLHSEYDSANRDLTADMWVSALRFDAAQTRAAFGQPASTVPYLFISAMPYYGTTAGHNAIREGMERLVADGGFNARIAARMIDVDTDGDGAGQYGGGHIDAEDAMQTVMRSARAIAETFAPYARPGSPVAQAGGDIADDGPQVIGAVPVAADQFRIDVRHDKAGGFRALDPDAARGVGWSVQAAGAEVTGTAARIEDADSLIVTFSGALPGGGVLHYGHGYGRLAGADGSGRGNAVYDDQGLPIWTPAVGVALSGGGSAPPPATSPMATPAPAAGVFRDGTADADNLRGSDGTDTLNGAGGEDDLQGFAGDDVLRGGRQHDGLTGGPGRDIFVFALGDGQDWVVDFAPGADKVWLEGIGASQVTQTVETRWGMTGLRLDFGSGDEMFLQGVTTGLPAGDLVFA